MAKNTHHCDTYYIYMIGENKTSRGIADREHAIEKAGELANERFEPVEIDKVNCVGQSFHKLILPKGITRKDLIFQKRHLKKVS